MHTVTRLTSKNVRNQERSRAHRVSAKREFIAALDELITLNSGPVFIEVRRPVDAGFRSDAKAIAGYFKAAKRAFHNTDD